MPYFTVICFQKPATRVENSSVAAVQKKNKESDSSESDSDDSSDEVCEFLPSAVICNSSYTVFKKIEICNSVFQTNRNKTLRLRQC